MNRWFDAMIDAPAVARGLALAGMLCALAGLAAAQAARTFPDAAMRGILVVTTPPEVTLDGQPARLSPGARIREAHNRIVLSGALVGQTLRVNYLRDAQGLIHEVWILSEAEARQPRAGNDTVTNFRFESEGTPAQTR